MHGGKDVGNFDLDYFITLIKKEINELTKFE